MPTVISEESRPAPDVATTQTEPGSTPVTSPESATVAISGLREIQITPAPFTTLPPGSDMVARNVALPRGPGIATAFVDSGSVFTACATRTGIVPATPSAVAT